MAGEMAAFAAVKRKRPWLGVTEALKIKSGGHVRRKGAKGLGRVAAGAKRTPKAPDNGGKG